MTLYSIAGGLVAELSVTPTMTRRNVGRDLAQRIPVGIEEVFSGNQKRREFCSGHARIIAAL